MLALLSRMLAMLAGDVDEDVGDAGFAGEDVGEDAGDAGFAGEDVGEDAGFAGEDVGFAGFAGEDVGFAGLRDAEKGCFALSLLGPPGGDSAKCAFFVRESKHYIFIRSVA